MVNLAPSENKSSSRNSDLSAAGGIQCTQDSGSSRYSTLRWNLTMIHEPEDK